MLDSSQVKKAWEVSENVGEVKDGSVTENAIQAQPSCKREDRVKVHSKNKEKHVRLLVQAPADPKNEECQKTDSQEVQTERYPCASHSRESECQKSNSEIDGPAKKRQSRRPFQLGDSHIRIKEGTWNFKSQNLRQRHPESSGSQAAVELQRTKERRSRRQLCEEDGPGRNQNVKSWTTESQAAEKQGKSCVIEIVGEAEKDGVSEPASGKPGIVYKKVSVSNDGVPSCALLCLNRSASNDTRNNEMNTSSANVKCQCTSNNGTDDEDACLNRLIRAEHLKKVSIKITVDNDKEWTLNLGSRDGVEGGPPTEAASQFHELDPAKVRKDTFGSFPEKNYQLVTQANELQGGQLGNAFSQPGIVIHSPQGSKSKSLQFRVPSTSLVGSEDSPPDGQPTSAFQSRKNTKAGSASMNISTPGSMHSAAGTASYAPSSVAFQSRKSTRAGVNISTPGSMYSAAETASYAPSSVAFQSRKSTRAGVPTPGSTSRQPSYYPGVASPPGMQNAMESSRQPSMYQETAPTNGPPWEFSFYGQNPPAGPLSGTVMPGGNGYFVPAAATPGGLSTSTLSGNGQFSQRPTVAGLGSIAPGSNGYFTPQAATPGDGYFPSQAAWPDIVSTMPSRTTQLHQPSQMVGMNRSTINQRMSSVPSNQRQMSVGLKHSSMTPAGQKSRQRSETMSRGSLRTLATQMPSGMTIPPGEYIESQRPTATFDPNIPLNNLSQPQFPPSSYPHSAIYSQVASPNGTASPAMVDGADQVPAYYAESQIAPGPGTLTHPATPSGYLSGHTASAYFAPGTTGQVIQPTVMQDVDPNLQNGETTSVALPAPLGSQPYSVADFPQAQPQEQEYAIDGEEPSSDWQPVYDESMGYNVEHDFTCPPLMGPHLKTLCDSQRKPGCNNVSPPVGKQRNKQRCSRQALATICSMKKAGSGCPKNCCECRQTCSSKKFNFKMCFPKCPGESSSSGAEACGSSGYMQQDQCCGCAKKPRYNIWEQAHQIRSTEQLCGNETASCSPAKLDSSSTVDDCCAFQPQKTNKRRLFKCKTGFTLPARPKTVCWMHTPNNGISIRPKKEKKHRYRSLECVRSA